MLPNVLQPNATDHVPVLADEVRELLALEPGQTVVDGTFGAGGHASLLARDLQGEGKVIAIDRDPTARPYFERFRAHRRRADARFLRGDFSIVLDQLAANGVRADAILLDLGVSSMQLDRPERGFSYAADAPLDMRMDPSAEHSARELVNEASERELAEIFRRYGEERFARQIARAIVRRRREQPFERTGELVETIKARDPGAGAVRRGPPGEARLPGAAHRGQRRARRARGGAAGGRSRCCGRAAGIAVDQLPLARGPDRQALPPRRGARGCTCPPDFPICVCGHEPVLRVAHAAAGPAVRRARSAANPRAASAALRVGGEGGVVAAVAHASVARRRAAARAAAAARRAAGRGVARRRRLDRAVGGAARRHRRSQRRGAAAEHPRSTSSARPSASCAPRTRQLGSQLSSALAAARIQAQARQRRLGLVPADRDDTTYARPDGREQ